MTSTERKLDEAKFFLGQLNPSLPYFDYLLSAYLNAARSTLWVMRHEFCKTEGWEKWFNECEISESEKVLLEKTNELRINSTKQSGIKTEFKMFECVVPDEKYLPIIDEMLKDFEEGDAIKITITEDLPNQVDKEVDGIYQFRGVVKFDKDESDMSREAIYKLCNEYFDFLKKHVDVCIHLFNPRTKKK